MRAARSRCNAAFCVAYGVLVVGAGRAVAIVGTGRLFRRTFGSIPSLAGIDMTLEGWAVCGRTIGGMGGAWKLSETA